MTAHKGMRPQDIVVLLKLISLQDTEADFGRVVGQVQLAVALGLSQAEVSGSLQRSRLVQLVREDKREVYRQNLLDFLFYGLRYVFPAEPGPLLLGMPTAHSAPPLRDSIISSEPYVWADSQGTARGQAIVPLYSRVPYAARQDTRLYELLTLTDALRVGRTREIELAQEKLKEYFHA